MNKHGFIMMGWVGKGMVAGIRFKQSQYGRNVAPKNTSIDCRSLVKLLDDRWLCRDIDLSTTCTIRSMQPLDEMGHCKQGTVGNVCGDCKF